MADVNAIAEEIQGLTLMEAADLVKNLEEKWLFELDSPRELCYYLAINSERLENEGGLHRHIVKILKEKPILL